MAHSCVSLTAGKNTHVPFHKYTSAAVKLSGIHFQFFIYLLYFFFLIKWEIWKAVTSLRRVVTLLVLTRNFLVITRFCSQIYFPALAVKRFRYMTQFVYF